MLSVRTQLGSQLMRVACCYPDAYATPVAVMLLRSMEMCLLDDTTARWDMASHTHNHAGGAAQTHHRASVGHKHGFVSRDCP